MFSGLCKKFKLYKLRERALSSWYLGDLKETCKLSDEYLKLHDDYIVILIKSLCLSAEGFEDLALDMLCRNPDYDYEDVISLIKKLKDES